MRRRCLSAAVTAFNLIARISTSDFVPFLFAETVSFGDGLFVKAFIYRDNIFRKATTFSSLLQTFTKKSTILYL